MAPWHFVKRLLQRLGLLAALRHIRTQLDPARRRVWQQRAEQIRALSRSLGPAYASSIAARPTSRCVLVTGMGDVTSIAMQAPLLNAFRLAGFRATVLSASPDPQLQAAYRLFGVEDFVHYEEVLKPSPHDETEHLAHNVRGTESLQALRYRDIAVGKYALSTAMRRTRNGCPDLEDGKAGAASLRLLDELLRDTDAAVEIVASVAPDATLCLDHGYTPDGPLFDETLRTGASCFTWNAAHRDAALILKRYGSDNADRHPSSLSQDSWDRLRSMRWTEEHWQRLRAEIEGCYLSGEWYGEVGTQFNRRILSRDELAARLGLRSERKVAAIFPHIFWDATFFWGTDIFQSYEAWFVAAVRAACANDRLDWIVKVHPGNVVKDRRDGHDGEHSEIAAIRAAVGELPPHVKLVPADSEISTYALYGLIDYCLTVRGTVGIEAACFGVPVITAGTGRYDRLGFTIDPASPGEYLALLDRIETLPNLSEAAVEIARRYAYGVFLARPAPLQSIRFAYRKDETASLAVEIGSTDPFGPDIAAIAEWIESGAEDFLRDGATR